MVEAVVCCTKCAKKFKQKFPDNKWGDMLYVTCPDGHRSYDVLDKDTQLDSNSLHFTELFDSPPPNPEDGDDKELALT